MLRLSVLAVALLSCTPALATVYSFSGAVDAGSAFSKRGLERRAPSSLTVRVVRGMGSRAALSRDASGLQCRRLLLEC